MADVISFPPRPADAPPAVPPAARKGRPAAPVASLPLILRAAPKALEPRQVALDLLAAKTNLAASPIWAARKAAFADLVAARGIRGRAAFRLAEAWRAEVRDAGISEKARRRAGEDAAFRFLDELAATADWAGNDGW